MWGTPASPYVRKVMVALAEKSLPYTHIDILPRKLLKATGQMVPDAFIQASPLGKIPALQLNHDFSLSDSAVIAQFLDLEFSTGHALYPRNPRQAATARWLEMYSDTVLTDVAHKKIFIEKVVKPKLLNRDTNIKVVSDALNNELPKVLQFLNDALKQQQWFVDKHFSMADIAVVTQLLALNMAGYTLPESTYPNLYHHLQNALQRPSLKVFSISHPTGEH